jgi:signal transduction protein with GAF and PtsI domain
MAPASLPIVRRMVRAATVEDAQEMLREAMALNTAEEIEGHVRKVMEERFADVLGPGSDLEELVQPA